VRAARAEGGHAVGAEAALRERGLLGFEEGQPGVDALGGEEAIDARRDHARDHRRGELAGGGQQPVAVVNGAFGAFDARPFALLVELADHARAHVPALRVPPVVELFLQLVLEQLALFLHHQDLVQPLGEVAHAVGFERPHHADLVQADADLGGQRVVDAEVVEGLAHVEIALAAGDDAQARRGRVDDDVVEAVGACVGERGVELVVQQALFLHQRRIGPTDVEAVRRQREVGGDDDLHACRVDVHRGRGLHRVGERLERHPAARIARQRKAMHAEVDVVLHARGRENRHHHRLEEVIGLMGKGGRLGSVIVAGHHQHAAVPRAAGGVGVAEHVAAAVHARALAVPHGEHALVVGLRAQIDLLRAPHRGRGEVFVDAGLEHDVARLQVRPGLPQRLVEPAERRATVTGHEARGVEAGGFVTRLLDQQQPDQRLIAGEIDAPGAQRIAVVQARAAAARACVGGCHACLLLCGTAAQGVARSCHPCLVGRAAGMSECRLDAQGGGLNQ